MRVIPYQATHLVSPCFDTGSTTTVSGPGMVIAIHNAVNEQTWQETQLFLVCVLHVFSFGTMGPSCPRQCWFPVPVLNTSTWLWPFTCFSLDPSKNSPYTPWNHEHVHLSLDSTCDRLNSTLSWWAPCFNHQDWFCYMSNVGFGLHTEHIRIRQIIAT